jgi:YHS domain-containing protein
MTIDLVCGNNVDEQKARFTSEYQGRKFYFCSRMCKSEFDEKPEKFLWMEATLKRKLD